jgi:hypothetical protein
MSSGWNIAAVGFGLAAAIVDIGDRFYDETKAGLADGKRCRR